MGYSAFADVAAEFKKVDFTSPNTLVPSANVTVFCAQADAYINAQLSTRYVVPITSANVDDQNLLKMISVTLAASRVRGILETKQNTANVQNQDVRGVNGFTVKDVKEMLQQLKDGTMLLSSATLLQASGLIYSQNDNDNVQPTFQVGVTQW